MQIDAWYLQFTYTVPGARPLQYRKVSKASWRERAVRNRVASIPARRMYYRNSAASAC